MSNSAYAEFVAAADALRASLPDHWHDDAVVAFDDARKAIEPRMDRCNSCGRETALFGNCFRRPEDCPQRSTLTAGEQK